MRNKFGLFSVSAFLLVSCGTDANKAENEPSLDHDISAITLAAGTEDFCPAPYILDAPIGLCINGENALGPFTQAMRNDCLKFGGGPACAGGVWNASFAKALRGTAFCMKGSIRDANDLCIEGENAFGPFTKDMTDRCKVAGGGTMCDSMRWSKNLAQSLLNGNTGEWQDVGSSFDAQKQRIRSIMNVSSDWSVDIRVITPTKKYIIMKHRGDVGAVPASTNKITSALSSHLNVGTSWDNMAWWIKESNNDAAERAWDNGGRRAGVLKALGKLGLTPPPQWANVDGSGLSYDNSIPSSFLVDILLAIRKQTWFSSFVDALPEGCRSGTLVSMFCEGVDSRRSIHAKTGTLNNLMGVKGLSGFGLTESGNLLVFTTLYNGPAGTAWTTGAPKIEAIVKEAIRVAAVVK